MVATSHFQELMRSLHEAREAFMPKLGQADSGTAGLAACKAWPKKFVNFSIYIYIIIYTHIYIYIYSIYIYICIWDLF